MFKNKVDFRKGTLFLIITIIILFFLFKYVNFEDILNLFSFIPLSLILLGFLFYVLSNIFRALRFYFLLNSKIRIIDLISIVFIHNFLNNIFPLRSGELSFLYLTKKKGISLPVSATTLISARVFDLFFVLSSFLLAISITKIVILEINLAFYFFVFLLILIISFFLILFFSKRLKSYFDNDFLRKVFQSVENLKAKNVLIKTLSFSFFIWFFQYLMTYTIFSSFLNLNFWQIVIGVSLPIISTVLPVQGFAGFGSIEGFWALGFFTVGVTKELAITSGFAFHIILIAYFTILGSVGFMRYLLTNKKVFS